MAATTVKVEYINHDSAGYSDPVEVPQGMTIGEFFLTKMPGKNAANYLIQVNREHVQRNYVLRDNDRVSITPTKVQGARA